MTDPMLIQTKRIYETQQADDGFRVLIDRLWPRGIRRENADVDVWAKEIAPSAELRKWFDHEPNKFGRFQSKYRNELDNNRDALSTIIENAGGADITLLYAARDTRYNHAVVLQKYLSEIIGD